MPNTHRFLSVNRKLLSRKPPEISPQINAIAAMEMELSKVW
jgi:hypothetical protein